VIAFRAAGSKIVSVLPLLIFAFCATAAATPETPASAPPLSEAELAAFQKNYADHRLGTAGWSGNFHQEAHSPDLLAPIISDGLLTYRAPATLEVTYTAPLAGEVWIRNGEVGQKFSGRAPQVAAQPMVRALLDFFRQPPAAWQKDFTTTARLDHDTVHLQLLPKPGAATGQPRRIQVEIDARTFDPVRLDIFFAQDASLTFIFSTWASLGPPTVNAPEPPVDDSTTASPRPRLPTGK